jgi:hypothetical protein
MTNKNIAKVLYFFPSKFHQGQRIVEDSHDQFFGTLKN